MSGSEFRELLRTRFGGRGARLAPLIERGIRRYLLTRGWQLDFFHGQLRQAVARRYAVRASDRRRHAAIADILERRWLSGDTHALGELPYRCASAQSWERLTRVLTDLRFIRAKCAAGLTHALLADLTDALNVDSLPAWARASSPLSAAAG